MAAARKKGVCVICGQRLTRPECQNDNGHCSLLTELINDTLHQQIANFLMHKGLSYDKMSSIYLTYFNKSRITALPTRLHCAPSKD